MNCLHVYLIQLCLLCRRRVSVQQFRDGVVLRMCCGLTLATLFDKHTAHHLWEQLVLNNLNKQQEQKSKTTKIAQYWITVCCRKELDSQSSQIPKLELSYLMHKYIIILCTTQTCMDAYMHTCFMLPQRPKLQSQISQPQQTSRGPKLTRMALISVN